MTQEEVKREMDYRREERLGILCGSETPTPEQLAMAEKEAKDWSRFTITISDAALSSR